MEQKLIEFSVLATTSLSEERTFKLKNGDSFAILNKYGDILPFVKSVQGLFYEGTRFLSEFQLWIDGQRPLYLSSDVKEGNEMISVDLTNPDIITGNKLVLQKGLIHIMRKKILWEGVYYEQMRIYNYGLEKIAFNIKMSFDADYDDIFEVRGTTRASKGTRLPPEQGKSSLKLGYSGLDNKHRHTHIMLCPEPATLENSIASYDIELEPDQSFLISLTIAFRISGEKEKAILSFPLAMKKYKRKHDNVNKKSKEEYTTKKQINH
jgi:glycogen debranching enzyme